jgi:hypothetical protein
VKLDAVREHQLLGDDLDLALAPSIHERVDLPCPEQRADEGGAPIALAQPAGIEDLGREHLDLEARRNFHLGDGQLVSGRGNREYGVVVCWAMAGHTPSARPVTATIDQAIRRVIETPVMASPPRPLGPWSCGSFSGSMEYPFVGAMLALRPGEVKTRRGR